MPVDVEVVLRERNQVTLPERVVTRLGAQAGDRLLVTVTDTDPAEVRIRLLRRSYAGIAAGSYGRTTSQASAYVATERGSWERPADGDPGVASDGTRYLSLAESQKTHPQTDVTRQRYDSEPWLRWPRCPECGRFIARMNKHLGDHSAGKFDDRGRSTDPRQRARSKNRVTKWRMAMAARKRR